MASNWFAPCGLRGLAAISVKLKRLKIALKAWNWKVFEDLFQKLNEKIEEIKGLERVLLTLNLLKS